MISAALGSYFFPLVVIATIPCFSSGIETNMAGYGHSHGSGNCDHESVSDLASAFSLYTKIDLDRVQCLNETVEDSGKSVFKPWDQKTDRSKYVESDADEELLFKIPFTGSVKLKGIMLIGGEEGTHPKTMRLFKNRPSMTFDEASSEPDQVLELTRDESGAIEYTVKAAKFSNISQLCIHFPDNYGADCSKVYYIGLKGDFLQAHRDEIVIVNYELNANPADHKADLMDMNSQPIS